VVAHDKAGGLFLRQTRGEGSGGEQEISGSMKSNVARRHKANNSVCLEPNRNDFRVIAPHDWTLFPPGKTNDRRFVSPRRDAWLSLYASHVRGSVSSHFHQWGVNAGDRVTYERQGQGWNVVSGYTADNRIFYRKTMLACGGQQWHNLEFEYAASDKPAMDEFVKRASYALEAYRSVGCG
jgi:hypothetical protein